MGATDCSSMSEESAEVQYCTGCKQVKPRVSFDGSSVCSECLCKRLKRKKTPVQASNSKRQALTIKEENVQLRDLLSQLASENEVLRQRVCLDSRAVLESEQQLSQLRQMLSAQMAGQMATAVPVAGQQYPQMRPPTGPPFMQPPPQQQRQSTLSRPLHTMLSDLPGFSSDRLMMSNPYDRVDEQMTMGGVAGKGNRSAGKGNRSAGKGNSSMDNHDSRIDILSTAPANGLGEMRMPATAVQVSPLFPRSMVPLSALSQQAFATSSQGGSEALSQNAVQQHEARV